MRLPGALLLALLVCFSRVLENGATITFPNSFTMRVEMGIKDFLYRFLGTNERVQARRLAAKKVMKMQPLYSNGPFPCNETAKYRSASKPISVHQLMPGDIDVIAAMGDSLTAGFGASATIQWQVPIENRGLVWSIGGDGTWRNVLTLPNILRQFNPALVGYSTGDGPAHAYAAGFNVAEGGATSNELGFMSKALVKRIKSHPKVNFEKDWKLVTILIGNNDICLNMCYTDEPLAIIAQFKKNLIDSLDYLRDNLPRTLINLVPLGRIDKLLHKMNLPLSCYAPHRIFCPCLFGPRFDRKKILYSDIVYALQNITFQVVEEARYNNLETFAVVSQPFTANLFFPSYMNTYGNPMTDTTLLSPDCFHLSQYGYARAANALWNNMLEPVGEKSMDWAEPLVNFKCPTESWPYFYTSFNSNSIRYNRSRVKN
ncbi:phospholipase B1, membrane-associated-like [Neocloeon triangulifer]|uniref:phospholipase B1, membrane-associated-like n=1 Tax=Neocloeon triangulifer TaxID=2078957 RepID=UPI00286F8E17|nr:phospholipase B1, membrane-associated-like [Neocloeon triangulifer]